MTMDDSNLRVLYDHYKDTYSIVEKTITQRDRNFIWAISLVATAFALTVNPGAVTEAVQGFSKEQLKISVRPAYYVFNSFLLFISLWFWIKYFHQVLQQERLYLYIHKIEGALLREIPQFEIC